MPAVAIVKSALEGAVNVDPIDPISPKSSSVPNSSALPAEFTLKTCNADPIELRPVPPNEVPIVSPDWNSAIPVATFELLKTTRTGVLSAIMFSYCRRPSCLNRIDILLTTVFN